MADEAFRHKFISASENEWESSLSLSFRLFFPLCFFQCLFLSPSLSAFPADTCRQAHTSREPTSEKCNLSISAPQREDKQCWKNEGINMLPSWCWTNMSRSLQFRNGPAAFGAHRCGNSRTNLIAPAAAVVVSEFVCLSCLSLHYCLTDSFLEECGPLKMTGEGWVLLNYENERISLHQMLSLAEEIKKQGHRVHRPSCWNSSSGESSVSLIPFGLKELQELAEANLFWSIDSDHKISSYSNPFASLCPHNYPFEALQAQQQRQKKPFSGTYKERKIVCSRSACERRAAPYNMDIVSGL